MDNTFFGTLFAGIILAFIGFSLYRKQKSVDMECEDRRKIRDLASLLLANIEIAFKKYEQQIDIYLEKGDRLNYLNAIKKKLEDAGEDPDKAIKELCLKVRDDADSLIALLEIDGNYDKNIVKITENIATFSFLVESISIIHSLEEKELKETKQKVCDVLGLLRSTLKEVIKNLLSTS